MRQTRASPDPQIYRGKRFEDELGELGRIFSVPSDSSTPRSDYNWATKFGDGIVIGGWREGEEGNGGVFVFKSLDSDQDGTLNILDDVPENPSQIHDTDGDGYGDDEWGLEPDMCPNVPGSSDEDRHGCPDSDGDGWSDEGEIARGTDPNDPESYPEDSKPWVLWIGTAILGVIILAKVLRTENQDPPLSEME